jgi:hypothetical protein
MLGKGC